ncbi:MAG: alpha/beta hydrolase [Sphingobacteriales bacterium]
MKTIFFALMLITSATFAQQKTMPLYPNGIPNSKSTPHTYIEQAPNEWGGVAKISMPTLTAYLPANGNGTAVLVIPGGGYSHVAMGHEGDAIAKEFNKIGVAAFVLKYRLPSDSIMVDKTIGPLQDAQMALLTIRKNAAKWGVDVNKVGVIGFSAGGHLASTLGTHFNKAVIVNIDNINLRPDFMALIYPVITFGPYAHVGSRENLIGKNPSQQLIDLYSNEKQVSANTPPTFLVAAEDDQTVPVQNTLMFYDALLQNKVKAEMHIYQAGGHGFGLDNKTTKDLWFERLTNWMDENGWLGKK